jgi:hypothetical protein
MLRTNLQAGTVEELWSEYMQLTEAEAAFRTLKSELYIRPLFTINWSRGLKPVSWVAFLGYALWVTLKHLLKRRVPVVLEFARVLSLISVAQLYGLALRLIKPHDRNPIVFGAALRSNRNCPNF